MAKIYTKATWIDEVLAGAARYHLLEDGGSPFKSDMQINLATSVTQAGSIFSAARMNNIEDGVDTLDSLITSLNNYQISPSVAGGNLTVAIKDPSGNNFSATNPARFKVGNTTYTATSAVSFTSNAGAANWLSLGSAEFAAKTVDLFMYAIGETGAAAGLKFGYARIPYARTMLDFANGISLPAHEKAIIGNHTNHNVTDVVTNIGRFKAQLTSGTYVWSIPTPGVVNSPIYNTDWLTWAPQFTGYSTPPSCIAEYQVVFDSANIVYRLLANGTSNANFATLTMPFAFAVALPLVCWSAVTDNSVLQATAGHMQSVTAGSNVLSAFKTFYQGAWTATSSQKGQNLPQFSYRLR